MRMHDATAAPSSKAPVTDERRYWAHEPTVLSVRLHGKRGKRRAIAVDVSRSGARLALIDPEFTFSAAEGDLGLVGLRVTSEFGSGLQVEFMAAEMIVEAELARLSEACEGDQYVVSIGCPTNIASALLREPSICRNLVVVWDAAHPSFWPYPTRSFNLEQDVAASQVLFDSGVRLVYVPGHYVSEHLRLSLPEVREWVKGRGPIGDLLHDLYAGWPLLGDHFARSWVFWDMANIAWLVNPDWLPSELVPTPCLGEKLSWETRPDAHEMREPVAIERDAIFADFFHKLERAAKPR